MQKIAIATVIAALAGTANAQIAQWDLLGAPGNQAFTTGTGTANVTANNLTRGSGITGNAGGSSFNSAGWNDLGANDFISFGFNVAPGFAVNLDSLYIGSRSSNTGPGFLGLFSSVDGFSTNLFTFAMTGTDFRNDQVNLSALTNLTGNVEFRVRALNGTSATGGAISSTGTFRLTAFFSGGAFDRNLQFTGTVVPTPGAAALAAIAGLVSIRRRRSA